MTSLARSPLRVALAGAGSVGTAVASLLQGAGHQIVGISSKSLGSVRRAERLLAVDAARPFEELARDVDLVLIGAVDVAIGRVAGDIGPALSPDAVVWHFAGSLGPDAVTSVLPGAHVAAAHPVQACPDVATAIARLPGSVWGVTSTSGDIQGWSEGLIEGDLAGSVVEVDGADRALWHAAAVATSNGIAALLAAGESILSSLGFVNPERILGPLAAGTVSNAREGGGGAATLTGPVVRGEVRTIERHLEALRANPALREAYVQVARTVLTVARSSDRIESDVAAAISTLLETP